MRKRRNNYVNVMIAIATILLLIVVAFIAIEAIDDKKKEIEYAESIQDFEAFSTEYIKITVMPRNLMELYKYKGAYDRDVLYRNMKIFEEYIGYLQRNVNTENAESFYKSHNLEIKDNTGITDLENFQTFVSKMEKHNVDSERYLYAEVVPNSSRYVNEYYLFDINFYYGESLESDFKEKVTFTVGLLKAEDSTKPVCIYSFAN